MLQKWVGVKKSTDPTGKLDRAVWEYIRQNGPRVDHKLLENKNVLQAGIYGTLVKSRHQKLVIDMIDALEHIEPSKVRYEDLQTAFQKVTEDEATEGVKITSEQFLRYLNYFLCAIAIYWLLMLSHANARSGFIFDTERKFRAMVLWELTSGGYGSRQFKDDTEKLLNAKKSAQLAKNSAETVTPHKHRAHKTLSMRRDKSNGHVTSVVVVAAVKVIFASRYI